MDQQRQHQPAGGGVECGRRGCREQFCRCAVHAQRRYDPEPDGHAGHGQYDARHRRRRLVQEWRAEQFLRDDQECEDRQRRRHRAQQQRRRRPGRRDHRCEPGGHGEHGGLGRDHHSQRLEAGQRRGVDRWRGAMELQRVGGAEHQRGQPGRCGDDHAHGREYFRCGGSGGEPDHRRRGDAGGKHHLQHLERDHAGQPGHSQREWRRHVRRQRHSFHQ